MNHSPDDEPTEPHSANAALVTACLAIARSGSPLLHHVVPPHEPARIWRHYPSEDAVDSVSGARWFYHSHPVSCRGEGEHGHFHLFLDRRCFARSSVTPLFQPPAGASKGADIVHLVAIAIDRNGLPSEIFTVNRWVTDEWLFPAIPIINRLRRFRFSDDFEHRLVSQWLTAMLDAFRPEVEQVLHERDRLLAQKPPSFGEDRNFEILSRKAIDLSRLEI